MPKIADKDFHDGAEGKLDRLGLRPLLDEVYSLLEGFELLVEEGVHRNSAGVLREMIDAQFAAAGGWKKIVSGGIDWSKCLRLNGTSVCIGVEIQVSSRSDILIQDIVHLRDKLESGDIDIGVIVVPTKKLGGFLTDRVPSITDARRHIQQARATNLPFIILSIEHDGAGPALPKKNTNRGRTPSLGTDDVTIPPDPRD